MKVRAVMALIPLSLSLALAAATPSAAAQGTGWIRWGNWSPSAPDFDIYLTSFGGSSGPTVIKHVRYGRISAFTTIPTGQYTIAMRKGGAAATSPPMLSASVHVAAGTAYTIVSMGAPSHLGVQVLTETMRSAPGRALVRVVQESVHQHSVTVTDGSQALSGPLQLGSFTGFLAVSPGPAGHPGHRLQRDHHQTGLPATQYHSHPRRARQAGRPGNQQHPGRGRQPGHASRGRRDRLWRHRAAQQLSHAMARGHRRWRASRGSEPEQAAANSPAPRPCRPERITEAGEPTAPLANSAIAGLARRLAAFR